MMRLPKWLGVIIVKRILETMKRTILASIFGALSLNAFAASPSYDFVKAGYVQADIEDAGDFEPTGFQIQGFKSLNENVYLTGRYGQLSEDVSGVDYNDVSGTISLHRKKHSNTLYTINALNECIKNLNNGVMDEKFMIPWENFKNMLLITNSEGLNRINTRIYKIIEINN